MLRLFYSAPFGEPLCQKVSPTSPSAAVKDTNTEASSAPQRPPGAPTGHVAPNSPDGRPCKPEQLQAYQLCSVGEPGGAPGLGWGPHQT